MANLDNIGQIIAAGFELGQTARLSSGGYPMGLTGSLSEGSSTGLYEVLGVRTANPQIPQAEKVTVSGNNRPLAAFLFPPGDTPEWDMDVAVLDMDLGAAAEAVKVRDLDKWSLHPIGAEDLVYQDMLLLLTSEAQSKDSGSDGLSLWYNLLVPRVKMAYLGVTGLNMRGENIARYHVIVSPSALYPWGEALSLANEGTGRAVMLEWTSENKITLDTIHLGAATAEITLARTPAMDTVDAGSGILLWVNGETEPLLTVTPSTKVATFAAQSQGDIGVVAYEYVNAAA
jgi:hypothetical protein